jgi:hypothetical protein
VVTVAVTSNAGAGVFVSQGVGAHDAPGAEERAGASGGVTTGPDRRIAAIARQRIANNTANKDDGLTNMLSL